MRNLVRLILIGAFAAGTVAATTVGAGAGAILKVNRFTVVKVVDGPVDPATTFTVGVDCEPTSLGTAGTTAVDHTDIVFDSTGQPKTADTVSIGSGMVCTATETVNGGATSTTYACDIVRDPSEPKVAPFQGNCTADNTARFDDVLGDTATITVTNTFPTPTPAPVEPPVVQAIQATPTFTG
jgi:hypothetical protein